MVTVKVCGLRREEDAVACRRAGVDLAGLNFVSSSRRRVDSARVRSILNALGDVEAVGLFQDEAPEVVDRVVGELSLPWIQLHGAESPEVFAELVGRTRVIKAFPVGYDAELLGRWRELGAVPLFDGPRPGSGEAFDWQEFVAPQAPFFVAGGLTPENVAEALRTTGATGVDTASGVEREGRIDPERVEAFVRAARRSEREMR